jgi:tripartite-type tricarboxylate transporter receptor subunit TctC
VIVDNKAGASGAIGAEFVAKAAADGYTLFSTATSFVINKALNPALRYDPIRQFSPLALIATGDMGLVVHPSLPVQNVADLIKLARSKPGGLTYASPGNGTPMRPRNAPTDMTMGNVTGNSQTAGAPSWPPQSPTAIMAMI